MSYIAPEKLSDEKIQDLLDNVSLKNGESVCNILVEQWIEFGKPLVKDIIIDFDETNELIVAFTRTEDEHGHSTYVEMLIDNVATFNILLNLEEHEQYDFVLSNSYRVWSGSTDEETADLLAESDALLESLKSHREEYDEDHIHDPGFDARVREAVGPYSQNMYNKFIQDSYGYAGDGMR